MATVNSVSGDMGTVAYNVSDQLGLGESDFLLLLDAQAEDWYLVYGTEVSPYVDNELEIIFRGAMDQMFTQPDRQIKTLFADLQDWCAKNLPLAQEEGRHTSVLSTIGEILFILIVLVVLVVGSRCGVGHALWPPGVLRLPPLGLWRASGAVPGTGTVRLPPAPGSHRDPPHRPGGFGGRGGFGGGSRGGFGGSSRGGGSHGGGFGRLQPLSAGSVGVVALDSCKKRMQSRCILFSVASLEICLVNRPGNGEGGTAAGAGGDLVLVEDDDQITIFIEIEILLRVDGLEVETLVFRIDPEHAGAGVVGRPHLPEDLLADGLAYSRHFGRDREAP